MATERLISADSHVNPPKDLWTRDAPERLKDRVPRVESTPQGDFWVVDSEITGGTGLDAAAGRKPEEFKAMGLGYAPPPAIAGLAVRSPKRLAVLVRSDAPRHLRPAAQRDGAPGLQALVDAHHPRAR